MGVFWRMYSLLDSAAMRLPGPCCWPARCVAFISSFRLSICRLHGREGREAPASHTQAVNELRHVLHICVAAAPRG